MRGEKRLSTVLIVTEWPDFNEVHRLIPAALLDEPARRELEVLALMIEPPAPLTEQGPRRKFPRLPAGATRLRRWRREGGPA